MKTCLFENYFVEYVSGELDKNEKNLFISYGEGGLLKIEISQ